MKPNTRVELPVAGQPEYGTVLKPGRRDLPTIDPRWCLVRFDGGGVLCVRASGLRVVR